MAGGWKGARKIQKKYVSPKEKVYIWKALSNIIWSTIATSNSTFPTISSHLQSYINWWHICRLWIRPAYLLCAVQEQCYKDPLPCTIDFPNISVVAHDQSQCIQKASVHIKRHTWEKGQRMLQTKIEDETKQKQHHHHHLHHHHSGQRWLERGVYTTRRFGDCVGKISQHKIEYRRLSLVT